MLRAIPGGWLSHDFTVLENDQPVASVRFAWFSGTGELTIENTTFTVRQSHPEYGFFVLEGHGGVIARARGVRTLFNHACTIEYGGRRYQIEDRSVLRRRLVVREGVQSVGYVEPERMFTRKVRACIPETLPLEVRIFILTLAIYLWTDQKEIM
jgi:hypothetical protein